MNFAEVIVRYRKELGLTQEGLAQKLGVTPSVLRELITQFKEMNCVYFTRLMEDAPDEKANDGL